MISSDTTDNRRTFDENRIAQFESDAIPQYRTVIRAIDMASLGVADVKALNDLMTAFGHQVEYFLQCFQSREYRRFCQGNRYFEWRNRLVLTQKAENAAAKAEGRAPQSIFPYNLQARQWKMALQAASDITERHFRLLQTKTMTRLRSRKVWKTLSKAEQHYVNGLFCGLSDRFFDLLDGKVPAPNPAVLEKGGVPRPRQLCDLLLEIFREVSGSEPTHGESRTVWFDTSCWTLKLEADGTQRVKLMTLVPGKRIEVRLKGRGPVKGTLMLVRNGGGFCLHVLQKLKPKKAKTSTAVSVQEAEPKQLTVRSADMGMTEVYTDDEGRQYGTELGRILRAYAEVQDRKLRERNRCQALANTTSDSVKRRHIRKFNLGTQKWNENRRRYQAQIESCVNQALNQMLRDGKPDAFIVEAFGSVFRMDGISAKVKNRLSRWVRGLIDERLIFKAAAYGVRIAKVPAAYSSQCCPTCGYVHWQNRNGDKFRCLHCGHEGHSDQVGALNLLTRMQDSFFERWTGKKAIERHLREKYEEGCRQRGEVPSPAPPPRNQVMAAKDSRTLL